MSRKPVTDPLEENPEVNDDRADVDPPAALETVTAERDRLAAENAELQDRFLRAQAEFQNFRKRVDKDRLELSEYASMEACRMLLPIIDDFERALETDTADKKYAQGLELIRQRLFDALKKLGLEPIVAQGEPFDPHIHHAVEMVETEDVPDHTVLAEFQRGYNFKGRLLRPAMVKVAVEPKRD
ncbi:MAG TPA: nucleotide exchange factor GrpE [Bryobacteraceae bacterium]|nr:nucleotide exchange factor GrpE [Bryobacteraceae bacterium]